MVYNEKTKRVIILLIATVMLLTAIPLDVFAGYQEEYGPSEEDDNVYQTVQEEMRKAEERMKKEFAKKGIDSIVVTGSVYDDYTEEDGDFFVGQGTIEFTVTMGDIHVATVKNMFDADAYKRGDRTDFDAVMIKASDTLLTESLNNIANLKLKLTEDQIIKLVETLLGNVNSGREQGITYRILKSETGKILIELTTASGESVKIELEEGMTREEATNTIQTAIQELISTLNEELKDLSGNEYFEELYGEYIIPKQVPLVYGAGGRVDVWTKGVNKEFLQTYEIPNVKDKNGDPIRLPVYGKPFGPAGDGTYRFLGYSPMGDPLTNPFFRNDKEANVKFWGREKFYEPWKNPKLKGIMANSRYKVDLQEIAKIDGNKELNPLVWMGLQEYWSGYINDPAEEKNDWINHVKFQIPPTDNTWGLAYFPSMIGSGFWYATIPIPPKSFLGIDIKTETIVATPAIVTGRKGKYPYSNFKCS